MKDDKLSMQSMHTEKQILSQSFKLPLKKQMKQATGLNYFSKQLY